MTCDGLGRISRCLPFEGELNIIGRERSHPLSMRATRQPPQGKEARDRATGPYRSRFEDDGASVRMEPSQLAVIARDRSRKASPEAAPRRYAPRSNRRTATDADARGPGAELRSALRLVPTRHPGAHLVVFCSGTVSPPDPFRATGYSTCLCGPRPLWGSPTNVGGRSWNAEFWRGSSLVW